MVTESNVDAFLPANGRPAVAGLAFFLSHFLRSLVACHSLLDKAHSIVGGDSATGLMGSLFVY
jgi:hypothetical protein